MSDIARALAQALFREGLNSVEIADRLNEHGATWFGAERHWVENDIALLVPEAATGTSRTAELPGSGVDDRDDAPSDTPPEFTSVLTGMHPECSAVDLADAVWAAYLAKWSSADIAEHVKAAFPESELRDAGAVLSYVKAREANGGDHSFGSKGAMALAALLMPVFLFVFARQVDRRGRAWGPRGTAIRPVPLFHLALGTLGIFCPVLIGWSVILLARYVAIAQLQSSAARDTMLELRDFLPTLLAFASLSVIPFVIPDTTTTTIVMVLAWAYANSAAATKLEAAWESVAEEPRNAPSTGSTMMEPLTRSPLAIAAVAGCVLVWFTAAATAENLAGGFARGASTTLRSGPCGDTSTSEYSSCLYNHYDDAAQCYADDPSADESACENAFEHTRTEAVEDDASSETTCATPSNPADMNEYRSCLYDRYSGADDCYENDPDASREDCDEAFT